VQLAALNSSEADSVTLGVELRLASMPDGAIAPWDEFPYKLVSWLDMERFAADKFCNICGNLAGMSGEFAKITRITPRTLSTLIESLRVVQEKCGEIGLKVSVRQFQAAIENMETFAGEDAPSGAIHSVQICQVLTDLNIAIASEMGTKLFLRVFPEREDFYEQAELFGIAVNTSFPGAKEDIKEAGCCYATDRNTATVMHLMRVLEVGLNTLADTLHVSFERRNWENVINDCEAAIKKISGPAWGADWKEKQAFYSGVAKDFRYFKDAWRNHAMHYRERYDAVEAKVVLEHVKTFMGQLADGGLKERL
jgi:hypothetical protein